MAVCVCALVFMPVSQATVINSYSDQDSSSLFIKKLQREAELYSNQEEDDVKHWSDEMGKEGKELYREWDREDHNGNYGSRCEVKVPEPRPLAMLGLGLIGLGLLRFRKKSHSKN